MILAWARLFRLSSWPSAASNVLTGFILVSGKWDHWPAIATTILAACFFYSAGVVGNDLHDFNEDKRRRPERPLPSGRISRANAIVAMVILFALAGFACSTEFWSGMPGANARFRGPAIPAFFLVLSIVLYDFVLKRFLVSALFMGFCRGLNLLLGATTALTFQDESSSLAPPVWIAASAMATYVAGLTLFARDESADRPRRWLMSMGIGMMMTGISGYIWMSNSLSADGIKWPDRNSRIHLFLLAVIAFTIFRSSTMACITADPKRIRSAVKTALFSLISLDSATVFLASGGDVTTTFVVLALVPSGVLLSRIVNPT